MTSPDRAQAAWIPSVSTTCAQNLSGSSCLLCKEHGKFKLLSKFTRTFPALAHTCLSGPQDKSCAPAVKLVHSPLPERTLRLPAFRPLLMPFPISATENPTQTPTSCRLTSSARPAEFALSSSLLRVVRRLAFWSLSLPHRSTSPCLPRCLSQCWAPKKERGRNTRV